MQRRMHPAAAAAARGSALLLLLLLPWLGNGSLAAGADVSRDRAFIGYSESQRPSCADQLPDCEARAGDNGCLYDAFSMRTFCPATCNIERCTAGSSHPKVKHKGFATPTATQRYAAAIEAMLPIGAGHWRDTTATQSVEPLKLSSLGVETNLGSTLGPGAEEAVEAAIIHSVTHGWNVIDTASWTHGGRAEACVGRALHYILAGDLTDTFLLHQIPPPHPPPYLYPVYQQTRTNVPGPAGTVMPPSPPPPFPPPPVPLPPPLFVQQRGLRQDITRDMLFISTKAGYLSPRATGPLIKEGLITSSDLIQGRHCMHPRCLEASLTRSRERLGLATIDLLYLHEAAEEQLAVVGREQFLARLLAAFRYLEEARADGLILSYGISSWDCFRSPPSHPHYLPLAEVVRLAEQAGGPRHGLRYLQLPINALMPEAWLQRGWQGRRGDEGPAEGAAGVSLLELAAELGLGVFASRPLMQAEAMRGVVGQVDGVLELRGLGETAGKLLQVVRSTPGVQAALVGHRVREFVEANLRVQLLPALGAAEFAAAAGGVAVAVARLERRQGAGGQRQVVWSSPVHGGAEGAR